MPSACWTATAANGAGPVSERNSTELLAFEDRAGASAALAEELGAVLSTAIGARGEASLVVSGGTSPVDLFRRLREQTLDWPHLTVVPSDEREVPPDHPDRNEAMIRRELLQGPASVAAMASLIPAGDIPERFDAAVLGMGADGHTASLFPGSPDLEAALESTNHLQRLEVPQLDAFRVSLTAKALLSSRRIYLLFFGQEKLDVYQRALAGDDVTELPVRVLLQQETVPVTVYWAP